MTRDKHLCSHLTANIVHNSLFVIEQGNKCRTNDY